MVMSKRALVIPDCHIPYEDTRAYDLMLEVAKDVDPDEIVILGDYADFYAVNSHGKDGEFTGVLLLDEVDAVIERLEQLNKLFPDAKKVFCEGNHEYRLARYINSKCPDLFGVVDVPSILRLRQLGYEYVPYGPHQKYHILGSKLIARHEPLAGGKHVAQNTVEKAMHSVIFGHTHRIQEAQIVTIHGENYRGISSGWLGDSSHRVMQYVRHHHQWALGFSVVTVLDDGTWFNNLLHIINYKCIYNGYLYAN
jgi:predicted MPP superfamily phosphohydrolase